MALPFFYIEDLQKDSVVLDEDTSKHVTQVLRMKEGEELLLTDGKGTKANATIVNDNRKRTEVKIFSRSVENKKEKNIAIAISIIKNSSRFEWFLEKATEIGVTEIIPLICERTEKEKFRFDRMKNILISAMLQSQQTWLPILHSPTVYKEVFKIKFIQKFIAHCINEEKVKLSDAFSSDTTHHSIVLIGPEGDFTPAEIQLALKNSFQPVSLGNTRLRTETAGIVAATLMTNL